MAGALPVAGAAEEALRPEAAAGLGAARLARMLEKLGAEGGSLVVPGLGNTVRVGGSGGTSGSLRAASPAPMPPRPSASA